MPRKPAVIVVDAAYVRDLRTAVRDATILARTARERLEAIEKYLRAIKRVDIIEASVNPAVDPALPPLQRNGVR